MVFHLIGLIFLGINTETFSVRINLKPLLRLILPCNDKSYTYYRQLCRMQKQACLHTILDAFLGTLRYHFAWLQISVMHLFTNTNKYLKIYIFVSVDC